MLFSQLELTLLSLAVVVDSVLFLILIERINRPNMATWLFAITLATWLLHAAGFCHALIRQSDLPSLIVLDRLNMIVMAINLLVIPCAMFHAAVRLNHTGYVLQPAWDWRYGFCYLPIVMLAFGLQSILSCEDRSLVPVLCSLLHSLLDVSVDRQRDCVFLVFEIPPNPANGLHPEIPAPPGSCSSWSSLGCLRFMG